MVNSKISIRIDLANGSRLGPGKVSLLESIKRCSSISAAARDQGMSYRRAWLLIDDMNRAYHSPVVETFPGRSQGKGATVTSLGDHIIALYRAAEKSAAGTISPEVRDIEAMMNTAYTSERAKNRRDSDDGGDA